MNTSKQQVEEMKQRLPKEVLLQYPTFQVWKKASEVTLEEADSHKIIAERWGNSYEGYLINYL